MKSFLQSKTVPFILKIVVTLLLIFLPIIPIWSAPVVEHPVASLRWFSIWQIVSRAIFPYAGVTYHWVWYSFAIFLALIAGLIAVWGVRRR